MNVEGMLPLGHVIVLLCVPDMYGMMTPAPLPAPDPRVTPIIVASRLFPVRSYSVVEVALAALYHPHGLGRKDNLPVGKVARLGVKYKSRTINAAGTNDMLETTAMFVTSKTTYEKED